MIAAAFEFTNGIGRHVQGANAVDTAPVVRDVYLRTLSRLPSSEELERAKKYIVESPSVGEGIRDLLWATLNTKEFIVNH